MTLKFLNTREDYYKSMRFLLPKTMGWKWYIMLMLAIITMLIGVILGAYRMTHLHTYNWYAPDASGNMVLFTQQENTWHAISSSVLLFVLGVFYLLLFLFRPNAYARRTLKTQTFLLEPTEVEFSDEGIEIRRIAAKANMQWSIVKTVYERPDFFGIVFNSASFIPIMKKHLTAAEQSELRQLLSARKEIVTK